MRKWFVGTMLLLVTAWPAAAQMHGSDPIEIPLRVHDGRLVVPVEGPHGAELEFGLTLATPTLISKSLAARLGAKPDLFLGGVSVVAENGYTIPDEQLTFDGKVLDGMIGPDTLNQFDVLLDVPGERLVLKEIGGSVTWKGMTMSDPVRLQVYHGMLLALEVKLNGNDYRAMLDLGASALLVNEPVKTQMQLDDADEVTLTVGNITVGELPVRVSDQPTFQNWDPNNDGFVMVGAPLAYDCAISISWVHREIRTCVR